MMALLWRLITVSVKAPSCLKVRLAQLVLRRVLIEKSLGDTKDSLEGNDLEGHKGE